MAYISILSSLCREVCQLLDPQNFVSHYFTFFFFFNLLFLIGVQLLYNVALVSAVS